MNAIDRSEGAPVRHLHTRTGILLGALLLIGGVTGCTDAGDAPKPSTTRTAPSDSAPTTSQAPSVEPARGAAVEIPVLTLRVTEDLRWLPVSTRLTASATAVLDDRHPATVTASELQSVQNDLDAYARASIEVSTYGPPADPSREPDHRRGRGLGGRSGGR